MAYQEGYTETNWENSPSQATPINDTNLNNIENGIELMDDRTVELSEEDERINAVLVNLQQVFNYLPETVSISINRAGDTGVGSVSWGGGNESSEMFSVSFGTENTNKARAALISGRLNNVSSTAQYATVFGAANEVSAEDSLTTGNRNKNNGASTAVFGADNTVAQEAIYSFGAGRDLTISSANQVVLGRGNVADTVGNYALIVGGGLPDSEKNIFTLDWNGNMTIPGTITAAGGTSDGTGVDAAYVETQMNNAVGTANTYTDAETSRATAAENRIEGEVSVLSTNLQTEINRATGAESELRSNMSGLTENLQAEANRATAAEVAITAKYDPLIPAQATETNKLVDVSSMDARVSQIVTQIAANRVHYNAAGSSFPTNIEAEAANSGATVYRNGEPYTPTKDDCLIVNADASAPVPFTGGQTRWIYDPDDGGWKYDIGIDGRPFTDAENAALASGATAANIASIAGKSDRPETFTPGNVAVFDANGNVVDGGATSGTSGKVRFDAILYAANWEAIEGGVAQTVNVSGTLVSDGGVFEVDTVGRDMTTVAQLKEAAGKVADFFIDTGSVYVRFFENPGIDLPIFWETVR